MIRDVRHAWRMLWRMPGLAAVVILSLGIGIGVNTAVFSWIQSRVLQPLPGVANSGSFLLVEPRAETGSYPGVSWLEYRDLREGLGSFRDLIASRIVPLNVGAAGWPERTYGLLVSGNYFSELGLRPALGRFVRPDEVVRPGGETVVVISHGFWQTRFNGSTAAVGQSLRVNDHLLTVIGVTPPEFQGTVSSLAFDLWVPATLAPALFAGSRELETRGTRGYSLMGTLKPGRTRDDAQADLNGVMERLARDYPDTNRKMQGEVLPFWKAPRGPQRLLTGALFILQGVMVLLLLVVCGNTANLVLARAGARQREIGVRLALGAGRWRIATLLLIENLMLALPGAALGALIAIWGTEALRAVPLPSGVPLKFQTGIDVIGVAFAALLGIGSGLLFGLPSALHLSRINPQGTLRSGSNTPQRSRMREALMGIEVALALVVLVVAGFFLKSFRETRDDPGFRREGVLLAAYDLTGRNVDPRTTGEFVRRLVEGVRAIPAVEAAAVATSVPLDIHGLPSRTFVVDGRARTDGSLDEALANTVTPDYFRTMGISLLAGMDFADLADRAAAPQVIVNEEFVRRYLGRGEPIGQRLESGRLRYVVAGIVKNSLYEAFGEPPTPAIYFSYRDRPSPRGEIHVRTRAGAEAALAPAIRTLVRQLDSGLPLYNVRTLDEHIETNLVLRRVPARMFAVLGPLLLGLAAIGVYAVVSYTVSQRTTEIGVRLALGATAGRVVTQFVGESLMVIGLGTFAGWLLAVVLAIDVLPAGSPDPTILLGVPALLLAVATFACWLPARRASAIDPIAALRQE
jgi:putative ABC transport system permease protein